MPIWHNAKPLKVRIFGTNHTCPSSWKHATDFRTQLSATDYGNFLANEPVPISTSTISDKATQVLVDQFNYIRSNAVEPLSKFLEYITYVPWLSWREPLRLTRQLGIPTWSIISFYSSLGHFMSVILTSFLNAVILSVSSTQCLPCVLQPMSRSCIILLLSRRRLVGPAHSVPIHPCSHCLHLKLLIFVTVFPLLTWTISILKSYATQFTRPTLKTSTITAVLWTLLLQMSCRKF